MAKPETVPASALPLGGVWADLVQDKPRGLLPSAERRKVAAITEAAPNWAGTILICAELSHWVQVSAGEIVSFQSFLTGRLCAGLAAEPAFDADALSDTMAQPERLAAHLRSAELEGGAAMASHLLGAELAATRAFWLGADVKLLGEGDWPALYEAALKAQAAFVSRA